MSSDNLLDTFPDAKEREGQTSGSHSPTCVMIRSSVLSSEVERPLEIAEDVRFTEQRHRVKSALESPNFKSDLEAVLKADDSKRSSVIADRALPLTDVHSCGRIIANQIPINDIRSQDGYTRLERDIRCRLTSLCRLISLHQWSSGIHSNTSVKLDANEEHFLVNPFGVMFDELTASSLIKVDREGRVVEQASVFCHNQSAFVLHSALYAIRPDVNCIVHLHSKAASVVSSLKDGVLPLSYEVLRLGGISYHDYIGISEEENVRNLLCNDLGPFNKVLVLRNHGLVVCGVSVEEAWSLTSNMMRACEIQCAAMAAVGGRIEALIVPSEAVQKRMVEETRLCTAGLGGPLKQWRSEDVEFEAAMRMLDNSGMRTGYPYKFPYNVKSHFVEPYDCTLPASLSSTAHSDQRRHTTGQLGRGCYSQKAGWLISPNWYVRQASPRSTQDRTDLTLDSTTSCSRWSADSKMGFTTPVRIDQHSFSPVNTDASELRTKHDQMKENRMVGRRSAGPLNSICRNIDKFNTSLPSTFSGDRQERLLDEHRLAGLVGTLDHKVLVGAVSRAIVKRDRQDDREVYKSPYSRNPFNLADNQSILEEGTTAMNEGDTLNAVKQMEDAKGSKVQEGKRKKSKRKTSGGKELSGDKIKRVSAERSDRAHTEPTVAKAAGARGGGGDQMLNESQRDDFVSDSSSLQGVSSPERKTGDRKKSSFRTPSFLKRTKKRSQSSAQTDRKLV